MKNKLLLTFGLIAMIGFQQDVLCQCVTNEANVYPFTYNGENYEIVKENLTWSAASACAVERGGFLAEIDSQEENDSLFYHLNNAGITAINTVAPDGGNASYVWIGGNDIAIEGEWIWDGDNTGVSSQFWQGTSAGNPIGGLYNNWGNEPDDWNNQDALGFAITDWPLGVAGQWNDVDETNTLYYIIEYFNGGVGLNSPNDVPELNLYPNPSNDYLTIELPDAISIQEGSYIKLYSSAGDLIKEIQVSEKKFNLSTKEFDSGFYFIRFSSTSFTSPAIKVFIN